ncbi:ABC transporter permease subunit, partial [Limimaricola sp. G21655-S1]|nr:ABC transporter permease subunit [Limimaricola sp. G21655-S1]
MTLGLALASLVGGMVLALAFSAAELSKQRALVWPVATLTTLIRGLPELLVVLFIYFGSTQVLFLITGEYVE